ncbi:MAG: tetratricopeptide repeat protein [Rhodospirillales bacterium]|nr:tetratricopeptide repeat protein [Rhodospirillales bacterium]
MALVLAPSAQAQGYEEAVRICVRVAAPDERLGAACTVVIDSGRAGPIERAAALNNRAVGREGGVAAAIRDLDAAIALAPTIAKLFHNRGAQRLDASDPAGALADFDTAVRLDPRYAVAFASRGEAYFALKRHREAIRDFSEAIRLAPDYVHPLYNPYESRARAKEAVGDKRGAAADRALYMPLFNETKAGPGRDRNTTGPRAWEPFIAYPKDLR